MLANITPACAHYLRDIGYAYLAVQKSLISVIFDEILKCYEFVTNNIRHLEFLETRALLTLHSDIT